MRRFFILAVAVAGACTPFSGTSDDALPVASDAGPADASANDGGSGADGGASCGPLKLAFKEPFDVFPTLGWSGSETGVLAIKSSTGASQSLALRLELPKDGGPQSLVRALGTHCRVKATVRVRIAKAGNGEVDFFGLEDDARKGYILVHAKSDGALILEHPDGTPGRAVLTQTFSDWTEVSIDVDFARGRALRRAGTDSFEGPIDLSWRNPIGLTLHIGAPYATDVTPNGWSVDFDDLVVETAD